MERISQERWHVEDTRIGDFIRVQIINKKGDRNLDGMILEGKIKDLVPSHGMVRLESGWCCHTKDLMLEHNRQERPTDTGGGAIPADQMFPLTMNRLKDMRGEVE